MSGFGAQGTGEGGGGGGGGYINLAHNGSLTRALRDIYPLTGESHPRASESDMHEYAEFPAPLLTI